MANGVFAQKFLKIRFEPVTKTLAHPQTFADSGAREQYLQSVLKTFQQKGYWRASLQGRKAVQDTLFVTLLAGEPVVWKSLQKGNVEDIFLTKVSLKSLKNKVFDYPQWQNIAQKIVENAENRGYPFAKVFLDSLTIEEGNQISATINLQKGFFVVWDTIGIVGNLKIRRTFLERYLRIRKDTPFSQENLQKAERLLKNLGFVKIVKPSQVVFESQKAKPIFYLNQGRSNEIDGILGVMPNELSPQSLLLTGQAQIRLRNLFNSAKSLEIEFQQLKPRHQLLNASYRHPLLLHSKLDFSFDFKLLREDTNFVNINRTFRFSYPIQKNSSIKLFGGLQSSQIGFTPNANIGQLPPNQESRYVFYGLGYEYNTLDDIFLPKNGFKISCNIQTGNKTIEPLPFLPDSLYQSIQLKSLQTSFEIKSHFYTMFSRKNGFYARLEGSVLSNPHLLQNELYRLGGLMSVRGFNQNFFFASSYALSTLEYRYFWQEDAYFSLFYDQAVFQTKILNQVQNDTPLGIGLGISFSTKGGIFNLSYATGRSETQNLSITKSKIHFGFISRF
jgi:outer membrane protein assembly factor BamA